MGRPGLEVQASQLHPHRLLLSSVSLDLLCALMHSHVGTGGAVPKLSHSMELYNISCYAEAFRVPFTGTKGPSSAPHHNPPPPNFTLGTMQSDRYRSPDNRQTQTRPSDCWVEKRDWSLQRRRLCCCRVQWQRALHHCIRRFALHLLMFGLDAATRPWKPFHEALYCS